MLIYRAHNIKTGKSYIGQTINSLHTRKLQHYRSSFCQNPASHFHKSVKCNGKEVWEWTVLYETKKLSDLNRKESYYIGKYDSIENGYNTLYGGGNSPRRLLQPNATPKKGLFARLIGLFVAPQKKSGYS